MSIVNFEFKACEEYLSATVSILSSSGVINCNPQSKLLFNKIQAIIPKNFPS